jgi:transposase
MPSRTAKGKTVEERARRRKETSQPLLEALHLWLLSTRRSVADGGALAKAIDYSLRRWPAFARYATNGFYPIDNNPVENAIRPIAIGKKQDCKLGAYHLVQSTLGHGTGRFPGGV